MDYRNLVDLFCEQAGELGPRVALRHKQHGLYRDITWSAFLEQVLACASSLLDAGIAIGDRVGLLSENRVEWLIADLAIMAVAAVNVPPHAPLTARQIAYQFKETGVRWLFASTASQ